MRAAALASMTLASFKKVVRSILVWSILVLLTVHVLVLSLATRPQVLHGLESSSSAVLPRSMSRAFFSRGFEVAAVNFRGCCGEENLKPHAYHLGFTDDLHFVLQRLHSMDPQRRLYLSGFSLGGNVILKCLGELGDDASNLGVRPASARAWLGTALDPSYSRATEKHTHAACISIRP